MRSSTINIDLLMVCLVVACFLGTTQGGDLRKNFYKKTCPLAEEIIRNATWKQTSTNSNLPAKLLRMHFHDCFVRGCDGSILLDSPNQTAEKNAIPNLSLAFFNVIDDIKQELERKCPGVVSCADILTLAARDSVSFQFQKPMWEVLTGRRDGKVSIQAEVLPNLPGPFDNFTTLMQHFTSKGLNLHDLVVLSGGHTIGVGHCNLFSNRLYNFTGKGDQDPSLNPTYAAFLKTKCLTVTDTVTTVEMDPNSSLTFDADYYSVVLQKKGLFQSDAALITNQQSKKIVGELVSGAKFTVEFAQSMKRMGAIGVLTGNDGEIRKKCNAVN
ncbi:peroxidase 27-like [Impatiens glandulifera]|uniref:peroxidase 27-like n=1 Tax=Impatiens glandulifera TaxID=253017 RepID=UPI001FB19A25|nr:peroxidase 27-like [Impatiens glandulifera]